MLLWPVVICFWAVPTEKNVVEKGGIEPNSGQNVTTKCIISHKIGTSFILASITAGTT